MERVVSEICGQLPPWPEDNVVELSSNPHQPRKFKFPKTEHGNKVR